MASSRLSGEIGIENEKGTSKQSSSLESQLAIRKKLLEQWGKDYEQLTIKQQEAIDKKVQAIYKKSNKISLEEAKKRYKEEGQYAITSGQKITSALKSAWASATSAIENGLKSATSSVDGYIGTYSQYLSGISTRLQGFSRDYNDISNRIKSGIGTSPYVKQTEVLSNLSKYVEMGVANNVEQRAFLATISDRIAITFKAFDSSLLRIIRIQQADTTAARLGLEASLTKYFNEMFGDTSYLSDTYTSVVANLLESSSIHSGEQSIAYEYAIQKWLGSMGSVGVSQTTLQTLASGINALGSGDISTLTSNDSLQRLLVTAAGSSYGDILTSGLNAQNANELLRNIVSIAQNINNNDNLVVRKQFANLYGFTLSDLASIANLSAEDLDSISASMLDYSDALKETQESLSTISSRTALKDMVDNATSNVMASIGESIASNMGTYITWTIADMMGKYADISISSIFTMGTGIDLNTSVSQLMKTGLLGYGVFNSLSTIMGSLQSGGALDLSNWGADDYKTRGRGITALRTTGISRGLSQSTFMGNSSASDLYNQSITNVGETSKSYTSATSEDSDLTEIVRDRIAVTLENIYSLLDNNGVKVRLF